MPKFEIMRNIVRVLGLESIRKPRLAGLFYLKLTNKHSFQQLGIHFFIEPFSNNHT